MLAVNPASFNANTDCTHNANQGWTCKESLINNQGSQGGTSLNWSASSSGISGVNFAPPTGTLSSGQEAQVTITVPNTTCPASATFSFTGPANIVTVPWSCTGPPILIISPSELDFGPLLVGSTATLQVAVSNTGGQPLTWNVDTGGTSWLSVVPDSGTIPTGGQQAINVTANASSLVPGTYTADLNLTSNGGNTSLSLKVVLVVT